MYVCVASDRRRYHSHLLGVSCRIYINDVDREVRLDECHHHGIW